VASTLAIEAELSRDCRPACARRAALLALGRTLWERHARRPFRRRREAEQALCERRLLAAERAAALAVGIVARTAPADGARAAD
jgi:hypothetical protein